VWIWGAVAGIAGFALHLVALSRGALSLVQPLLVSGLLFALPIGRLLDRRPIRLGDIAAAGAVVSGLALFQLTARPSAGRSVADLPALGWCAGVAVAAIGIVLALSSRRSRDRAVWLGLCTGAAYGVVAALLKSALGVFAAHGIAATLTAWPLYAFVALVCGAIVLNQLAFNAGPLAQSLPLITIVDPVVSVVVGAVAFGETVSSAGGLVVGQVFGFIAMSVGVVVLSRRAERPNAAAIGPNVRSDALELVSRPDTHLCALRVQAHGHLGGYS
jgi:drug/metabolite transporter (DMT)-like permease